MTEFGTIVRNLLMSPLFYLYWAVRAAEATGNHFNQGLTGSATLGATVILLGLVGLFLFYAQLSKLENPIKSAWGGTVKLFLRMLAFRLQLLLLFSPLIFFFYQRGLFGELFQAHFGVIVGSPQEIRDQAMRLLAVGWPILLTGIIFLLLDQAGRSAILAGGRVSRALPNCLRATKALAKSLCVFTVAEVLLLICAFVEVIFFFAPEQLPAWFTPASSICLSPVFFLLEIGAMVYMTHRLKVRAVLQ